MWCLEVSSQPSHKTKYTHIFSQLLTSTSSHIFLHLPTSSYIFSHLLTQLAANRRLTTEHVREEATTPLGQAPRAGYECIWWQHRWDMLLERDARRRDNACGEKVWRMFRVFDDVNNWENGFMSEYQTRWVSNLYTRKHLNLHTNLHNEFYWKDAEWWMPLSTRHHHLHDPSQWVVAI